ncbi:MAG: hypothetical protein GVY30_06345 [Chloroflexi bacterium]|jgi:hypothetical protein|nr:hypothetical protein [Chloroflexota bacterium]
MVGVLHKFEVLKDTYDTDELDLILGKLLDVTLHQYRARLERYDRDLHNFEVRYDLDSKTFSQEFESGKLGDAMDFFEWRGLYELRQDLVKKIARLESVA